MANTTNLRSARRDRVRRRLRRRNTGRLRLSVFRSSKNIYVQVTGGDKEAAAQVGKLVAERALAKGINEVMFDRGSYMYHGRVKALAEAAREGGLKF